MYQRLQLLPLLQHASCSSTYSNTYSNTFSNTCSNTYPHRYCYRSRQSDTPTEHPGVQPGGHFCLTSSLQQVPTTPHERMANGFKPTLISDHHRIRMSTSVYKHDQGGSGSLPSLPVRQAVLFCIFLLQSSVALLAPAFHHALSPIHSLLKVFLWISLQAAG